MKTYSIGRDLSCDIIINDSTDVISRRHALLNITPSGKMTIIDQSSNGTYVNGIRITQNVPVPVTRKDIVSLAHVAKLDWNQVPKSNQWIKYVIIAGGAIVLLLAVLFGIKHMKFDSEGSGHDSVVELADSTAKVSAQDSIKNVEKADTVKKTGEKVRQDTVKSTNKSTKNADNKKDKKKAKKDDKSQENKDKGKDKPKRKEKRTIG